MADPILLGDDEGEADSPSIFFDPTIIREITATNFVNTHAPKREMMSELSEGATDLGDGFLIQDEPVLVERDQTGGIVRLTPLSEMAGVNMRKKGEPDLEPVEGKQRETLHPISRDDRRKLVTILAVRLLKNYMTPLAMNAQAYNPIRDGLPDVPTGSEFNLEPLPGTDLYPASVDQVLDWLKEFVGARASVINKNRFGSGYAEDLAIRIE